MRPGVTRRAVNEKTIHENRGETHSDKKKKLLVCRCILCCPDKQFTSVGCVTQTLRNSPPGSTTVEC